MTTRPDAIEALSLATRAAGMAMALEVPTPPARYSRTPWGGAGAATRGTAPAAPRGDWRSRPVPGLARRAEGARH